MYMEASVRIKSLTSKYNNQVSEDAENYLRDNAEYKYIKN